MRQSFLILACGLFPLLSVCLAQESNEEPPNADLSAEQDDEALPATATTLDELLEAVRTDATETSPDQRCSNLKRVSDFRDRQLTELQQELEEELTRYTEQHPLIIATRSEIAELENQQNQGNAELADCARSKD